MSALCHADCKNCGFKDGCTGCENTFGSPFGGRCVAAEHIKIGGIKRYSEMKEALRQEINGLLASLGLPAAEALYELKGGYVNLEYELPGGQKVKFLKDNDIYLGAQIELSGLTKCIGVVAEMGFMLICSYGENGCDPELICYKRR